MILLTWVINAIQFNSHSDGILPGIWEETDQVYFIYDVDAVDNSGRTVKIAPEQLWGANKQVVKVNLERDCQMCLFKA